MWDGSPCHLSSLDPSSFIPALESVKRQSGSYRSGKPFGAWTFTAINGFINRSATARQRRFIERGERHRGVVTENQLDMARKKVGESMGTETLKELLRPRETFGGYRGPLSTWDYTLSNPLCCPEIGVHFTLRGASAGEL